MPQQTASPFKKRKQAVSAASPSKYNPSLSHPPSKDKGKAKEPEGSEFRVVHTTLTASVPPFFANKPRDGVEELLDSMIMRYIPALEGVVLSHSNLTFTQDTGLIKGDCPFLICNIAFDAVIWSPRVGMRITGQVNLCSPDHISLLVHRTFNVSIPRRHIPVGDWEFEYGPAENDPEYRTEVSGTQDNDPQTTSEASKQHDSGRWIHKLTAERIGGGDGTLCFTVIGLTMANEMLSLVGSIQPDPFSPTHITAYPHSQMDNAELSESDELLRTNRIPEVSEDDDDDSGKDSLPESDEEEARVVVELTASEPHPNFKRKSDQETGGQEKKKRKKKVAE